MNKVSVNFSITNLFYRFSDLLTILVVGWVVFIFQSIYEGVFTNERVLIILLATLLHQLVSSLLGLYSIQRGVKPFSYFLRGFSSYLIVFFLLVVILSFGVLGVNSKWLGLWVFIAFACGFLLRWLLAELAGFLHAKGHNRQRIIIITDGCSGGEVAENLQENDFLGMEIVGFVTLDADMSKVCSPIKSKWQILGYLKNLEQLVSDHQIHQVWITLPITKLGKLQEIKNSLILTPVCVHMVVDNLGFSIFRQSTSTLGNTPVINLVMSPLERSVNQIMKNSLDKFIAGLLIILIAPFMLLIAISIYMTSRGPILFRQKRVTKNGQIFEMIKFRSMIVDADGKEPVWGDARNKRVTKLGLLLRQSSLDELPQLFNVLIGDMSIVGPRPERPEFVEKFKHEIPGYNHKHLIKAGIAGWAQINGWRGDTDLRKRIEHDIYYIENWSLWLDLRIIFMTIFTGMVSKYAY